MKQRIQVLVWNRHTYETDNIRCCHGKDTHMKQIIQVLAWNRHTHETENSGAGVEQTHT
jgi:uncharacterized protein YaeQ